MPERSAKKAADLSLDLENYRMTRQEDETASLHGMIAVGAKDFWGLMESILDEGYTGEGNLIVIHDGEDPSKLVVKEGNRRLAAIKVTRGLLDLDADIEVPPAIKRAMARISAEERSDKKDIPVLIYPHEQADIVDRIVSRKHGKGGNAGRAEWNSVPRARHNRAQGANEYGLDLLEKYIVRGKNLTPQEKAHWQGVYTLTVLDEALGRIVAFLGRTSSVKDLVAAYPKSPHRVALESVLAAIGRHELKFPDMRSRPNEPKWSPAPYGFAAPAADSSSSARSASGLGAESATERGPQGSGGSATGGEAAGSTSSDNGGSTRPDSFATYKELQKWFGDLRVVGDHREKVAILAKEAAKINVNSAPHAVAFVVRSMFD